MAKENLFKQSSLRYFFNHHIDNAKENYQAFSLFSYPSHYLQQIQTLASYEKENCALFSQQPSGYFAIQKNRVALSSQDIMTIITAHEIGTSHHCIDYYCHQTLELLYYFFENYYKEKNRWFPQNSSYAILIAYLLAQTKKLLHKTINLSMFYIFQQQEQFISKIIQSHIFSSSSQKDVQIKLLLEYMKHHLHQNIAFLKEHFNLHQDRFREKEVHRLLHYITQNIATIILLCGLKYKSKHLGFSKLLVFNPPMAEQMMHENSFCKWLYRSCYHTASKPRFRQSPYKNFKNFKLLKAHCIELSRTYLPILIQTIKKINDVLFYEQYDNREIVMETLSPLMKQIIKHLSTMNAIFNDNFNVMDNRAKKPFKKLKEQFFEDPIYEQTIQKANRLWSILNHIEEPPRIFEIDYSTLSLDEIEREVVSTLSWLWQKIVAICRVIVSLLCQVSSIPNVEPLNQQLI